jgi:hypothetical protein
MLHLAEFGKVFEMPIKGYQPELSKLSFNFHKGKRLKQWKFSQRVCSNNRLATHILDNYIYNIIYIITLYIHFKNGNMLTGRSCAHGNLGPGAAPYGGALRTGCCFGQKAGYHMDILAVSSNVYFSLDTCGFRMVSGCFEQLGV